MNEKTVKTLDWSAYLDSTAAIHKLQLDETRRTEILVQLERIDLMAAPLLAFPLDPEIEPAPIYYA